MQKRTIAIFAVFAALLVVTAAPASAATLRVVSQNTTDSDFQNASVSQNLEVVGSGSAASLDMVGEEKSLTFNDGSTINSRSDQRGMQFEADKRLTDVTVRLHPNTGDPSTARLYDGSSTLISEQDISGKTGGDNVSFPDVTIDAGERFYVVADGSWQNAEQDSVSSYNDNDQVTIISAIFGDLNSPATKKAYTWSQIWTNDERGNNSLYVGDSHNVTDPDSGFVNISLSNATANITWEGDTDNDASYETTTSTQTISSTGNYSTALPSTGDWRVRVEINASDDIRVGDIESEGILAQTEEPEITGIKPADGFYVSDPQALSANISDADFATAQGDSVDVDFLIDGTVIGGTPLTSNGSVQQQWDPSIAGAHDYQIRANDSYGNVVTTVNRTLFVASNITLRNETNPQEVLTQLNGNATVQIFGETDVFSRDVSNGRIDLTGLPSDEPLIVTVQANGWVTRTVYLPSLLEQRNVYLLNETVDSVESRFVLEDPTGSYPTETILYVEKPINLSGNTQYRILVSDRFGVEGVTTTLEQGQRYQISIQAPDGRTQDIGPYRADVSETVTVRPGSPTISFGNYTTGWATNATIDNDTIEFGYSDPENETDLLRVYVHERGNQSNILGTNRSYSNLGTVVGTYSLTANQTTTEWVINYEITRDGETFTKTVMLSNRPGLVPEMDDVWKLIVGITVLVISAGIFSQFNVGIGAVIVALEGGVLWWSGWLPGATSGAAVAIAIFIGVLFNLHTTR